MSALGFNTPTGNNFAPAEGLRLAASRKKNDKTVEVEAKQWFADTRKKLEQENSITWRDQTLLWELLFAFISEGKSLGRIGKNGSWRWAPMPKQTDQPIYGHGLAKFYSRNVKAKWTQSNTDVRWRPTSDADKTEGAAKFADKIHLNYRRKLYTEDFKQGEAMLAQCGKYARYYYYSDEVKRYARRPKIEKQQLQFGSGSWYCADCGNGGDAGQLAGTGISADGLGQGLSGNADVSAGNVGSVATAGNSIDPLQQGLGPPPLGSEPYEQEQSGDLAGIAGMAGQSGLSAVSGMGQGSSLCPTCASPNLDIQQVPPLEVETQVGHEHFETGDIVCESVSAFELKHDIGLAPQDSPYLIRRRRVRVAVLQSKFPDIQINAAKSQDDGMRAQAELRRASASQSRGRSLSEGDGDEPLVELIQVWLDPCLYSQQVLKQDYQTAGGETIPVGTRLIEMFPTGMYQCWIEGVEGVVELRDEHHRDYWVGGEYDKRAISAMGSGLEDIVRSGMQYDLIMSIIYMQLRSSALPATLFEQKLLPNGMSKYLGSLDNIPVDTTALEGKSLRDAVFQLTPQPPTNAHFGYSEKLHNHMQMASGIIDIGFGQALGRNNTTATAVQETTAQQQGLFGPQLALKAEVDRRGAEIILQLFKWHTPDEVYVVLQGKRGAMDGEWVNASQIGVEMFAEVAQDSFLPQTNLERRERMDAFLSRVGGLQGLQMAMQTNPAFVETLAELCDVDLGGDDYSAAAEVCRMRLEQMKAAEPMVQIWLQGLPPTQMQMDELTGQPVEVPVDPMEEAGQMLLTTLKYPVDEAELGHLSAIAWLRSFLTEDEGLQASPILRAGVKAMMKVHVQGLMMEGQITGMVGMAGQPMPMMDEQNADGKKSPAKQNPQVSQMQVGGQKRPSPNDVTSKAMAQSQQMGAMV